VPVDPPKIRVVVRKRPINKKVGVQEKIILPAEQQVGPLQGMQRWV
jgi:hypothetical protein